MSEDNAATPHADVNVSTPSAASLQGGIATASLTAPSVSVLIATKNRPDELGLAVGSVLEQSILPIELLVMDQSSNDLGRTLVEQRYIQAGPRVGRLVHLQYILDSKVPGLTAARNRMLEIARGDIILFIDDDSYLEADCIQQMLRCYEQHSEAAGVGGLITNYVSPSWMARLWPTIFVRGPFFDERQPIYWAAQKLIGAAPISVRKFTGACMSFRSKDIRTVRFNQNLTGGGFGEDADFCLMLQPRLLLLEPKARLVHKRSPVNRAEDHWLREHAQVCYYLYIRHWKSGLWNRLWLVWLIIGYNLAIPLTCLRRCSLSPWRAFRVGRRDGLFVAGR